VADIAKMFQAFEVTGGNGGVSHARTSQPATAGKRGGRNRERGTTCGVFITGNGAEHTDTGFTVCAENGGKHKDKLRV
jgi:hypothetical protein